MFVKAGLSGAPTGNRGIKVVATATPGTTIHTAVTGTLAGTYDEIWLWAYNGHTADVTLTMEMGGATVPDDNIVVDIPTKSGLYLIVPGLPLQNGLVVRAFASVANVIVISGYVNKIS